MERLRAQPRFTKVASTLNMFATPRPKKSLLPPQGKKRKLEHKIQEITFDNDARTEYLTGFHKRKQARIKQAQQIAQEKARKERIEMRKQVCQRNFPLVGYDFDRRG